MLSRLFNGFSPKTRCPHHRWLIPTEPANPLLTQQLLLKMASIISTNRSYLFCKAKCLSRISTHNRNTLLHFFGSRRYYCFEVFTVFQSIFSPKRPRDTLFRFDTFFYAFELTDIKAPLCASRKKSGAEAPSRPGFRTPPPAQGSARSADREATCCSVPHWRRN